jgi:hypothetical protein
MRVFMAPSTTALLNVGRTRLLPRPEQCVRAARLHRHGSASSARRHAAHRRVHDMELATQPAHYGPDYQFSGKDAVRVRWPDRNADSLPRPHWHSSGRGSGAFAVLCGITHLSAWPQGRSTT